MMYFQIGTIIGTVLSLAFLAGYFIKPVRSYYWKGFITKNTLEAFTGTPSEVGFDYLNYLSYLSVIVAVNLIFMAAIMLLSIVVSPLVILGCMFCFIFRIRLNYFK